LFEKQERPRYGAMTMLRRAPRINGAREPHQRMPPLLGEHTEEVLRELGYDDASLAKLRAAKVI
jgi:crotonobetainyl-CoA:carnitine CoA-transferase CaiB-like acyl-CoA transferase